MNLRQALRRAREILAAGDIEYPHLEGELLLRHALQISRVRLFQELDQELSPEPERLFWKLIQRRLTGEPAAYITGHREFYGLDFQIDPCVLIPRPESELLVENALAIVREGTVVDIGTGCGAIAISLALNLPQVKIYATDVSVAALEVARLNCQRHGVLDRIQLLQGDMLDPLPEPVDLIIANPPYVRQAELSHLIRFEPRLALDGGADGLDKVRQLCRQAGGYLRPGGSLLMEMGQGQHREVTTLLRRLFPGAKIEVIPDLSGIERVVSLTLTTTNHRATSPIARPATA